MIVFEEPLQFETVEELSEKYWNELIVLIKMNAGGIYMKLFIDHIAVEALPN